MATSNVSQTYDDYIKEIQTLTPEEQLSLIEIISVGLKKTLGKHQLQISMCAPSLLSVREVRYVNC